MTGWEARPWSAVGEGVVVSGECRGRAVSLRKPSVRVLTPRISSDTGSLQRQSY